MRYAVRVRLGIRVRPLTSTGFGLVLALVLPVVLAACGGRTLSASAGASDAGRQPSGTESRCDGLDDDADGHVDEGFRDAKGRYVDDLNCGACGQTCSATIAHATAQGCGLIDESPRCVARSCEPGFGATRSGGCTELDARLCLPCVDDVDCGTLAGASCVPIGGELRCSRPCGNGCPDGYVCEGGGTDCVPSSSSCSCEGSATSFELACRPPGAPEGCAGRARCEAGTQSVCVAPEEGCNGQDDDCDGNVDETFIDVLGSYSLSDAHCGACGIACASDDDAGLELTCGGDPFAPSCIAACPDLADGVVDVGDHLDANRVLKDGCECAVRSLADPVGKSADDEPLDSNCDGADGSVLSSFYVSVEGDDAGPGSPTRPLRSLDLAIQRAAESLRTDLPRPHVFVASGVYLGTVHLRDGVQLHGGFRGDYLAQSAEGFEVIVIADAGTDAPGGAALVIERGGDVPTLVEGITFRGRDAARAGEPAVAVVIDDPGTDLTLRDLRLRTGRPADGLPGEQGDAGRSASADGQDGQTQRAAVENASHQCVAGNPNDARGGDGGHNVCADGVDVAGGRGGNGTCPQGVSSGHRQQSGEPGVGVSGSPGGLGGVGGHDIEGPIVGVPSCAGVCCGLADFTVPNPFTIAQPGRSGADGRAGLAGDTCDSPLGMLDGVRWSSGSSEGGQSGGPGGGGGGGGAGSGALMNWIDGVCEFADGLGGAGGGGGAGGCGGKGGGAGQSGGAAIGLVIHVTNTLAMPTLKNVRIETEPGGDGGPGGAGGDGGLGRSGGFGGDADAALRSTPTLAGPMPGQRGGKGGRGGSGGGGGGGCGGPTVGVWISGATPSNLVLDDYRSDNAFELGPAGKGGLGGSGGVPAGPGADGERTSVVVQ